MSKITPVLRVCELERLRATWKNTINSMFVLLSQDTSLITDE
jgi:hypothetical protein